MRLISFDLETELIAPGYQAPAPVCLSWAPCDDPERSEVVPIQHARDLIRWIFAECDSVGVNIAFDVCVLLKHGYVDAATVLDAYARGGILELGALERLAEIGKYAATKVHSLGVLAAHYGVHVDKASVEADGTETKLSYGPLRGKELDAYSYTQLLYAAEDATAGATVANRQMARFEGRVMRADWEALSRKMYWLRRIANEGMTTDPARVDILEFLAREQIESLGDIAKAIGLIRPDGTRDMKAIRAMVAEAYEGAPPMTEPTKGRKSEKPFVPQVSTSHATLIESGDPLLETFAEFGEWNSVVKKDLKYLRDPVIHTTFRLAETTRTTSSNPNLQNLRRQSKKQCLATTDGGPCGAIADEKDSHCHAGHSGPWLDVGGIRECFVPRDGFVFVAADHGGLELCTLAQCCVSLLGRRGMADRINRGEDLHSHVGSEILSIPYDSFVARRGDLEIENARNCGKVPNFGCPGGMGANTLVHYAKQSYGITIDLPFAKTLIESWRRSNPDGQAFLEYVRRLQRGDRYDVQIPGTTILRRGCTYCSACNTHFQGLGTVIEGAVGFEIMRAIDCGTGALRYCRPVMFVHDEFIVECPRGIHTEAAIELRTIMISAAAPYLPDVRIDAEPVAMARWSKRAKPKWKDGELIVWE